jgi:16S rRNA (cytidine1402-2'-O)-methyltransferase
LTKLHETVLSGRLGSILQQLQEDGDQRKGEFVILVRGNSGETGERIEIGVEQMLATLLAELPLKQAVSLTSKLSGVKKNNLYKQALKITEG